MNLCGPKINSNETVGEFQGFSCTRVFITVYKSLYIDYSVPWLDS